MFTNRHVPFVVLLGVTAVASYACGSNHNASTFSSTGADASDEGSGSLFGDNDSSSPVGVTSPQDDFQQPVLDTGVPTNAPALFAVPDLNGDGGSGVGPCLYEPELGSLFPNNWLRPRFRFTTSNAENLFEITLTIPNEIDPLVIYTTASGYTMALTTWQIVTRVGVGGPIHVTVRSAVVTAGHLTGGPWMGSDGQVEIAPVSATGSVVYWTTSNGTVLKGFHIGDESVETVLTPAQANTQCVAYHTSTPDGLYVGFTNSSNPNDGSSFAAVDIRSLDGKATQPAFLTASGAALLARTGQHAIAFSPAHWTTGDMTAVSMLDTSGGTEIIWTDLEATSQAQGTAWGTFARTGDSNSAASAQMSHDGEKIVYTSATSVNSGTNTPDGLIYTIPYNSRMGGQATPLNGASDSTYIQYYPVFSADDRFVAFTRAAAMSGNSQLSYNNPDAEVFVVTAAGGTPTRLAANDPPACLHESSPGVTNSWPKWSPQAQPAGGKTYYFLVFSSTRDPNANGAPQLYATPIVVDASGAMTSYAALYFWNQPETEHNHTPAWDTFQIPPIQVQ